MTQAEWSELVGEQTETLLAVLLYNEHPTATRVRPSRGNYGIDVLDPNPSAPETFDVYQIKKFAQKLTANQKGQIDESFRRLLIGLVRHNVPIADWYLVMPLDPTIDTEFLGWFNSMPDRVIAKMFEDEELALTDDEKAKISAWRTAPGRIIKWEGRPFCISLASKYGYVVDYYLHGGRERVLAAFRDFSSIYLTDASLPDPSTADPEAAPLLTPAELQDHLFKLQRVLDTDPHFRYRITIEHAPSDIVQEPDLVAATQATAAGGSTVTVRIYRRFAEALNERPIPLEVTFLSGHATYDQQAVEMWRKYGMPLTVPAEVEADLPGGLGDALSGGVTEVTIRPVGQTYDARFRIRKPDGTFGVTLSFSITVSRGSDGTGTWERGTDDTGFLTIEITSDMETHTGTWNFVRNGIVGAEVVDALPSVEFLQDLHAPNVLQVAQKYGPFGDYGAIPPHEPKFPDALVDYLRALAIIQTTTPTPILIPDLTTVTVRDVQAVTEAATLIDGQPLISSGWQSARFKTGASSAVGPAGLQARQIDLANHYQVKITEPLVVKVGTQELTIGAVERLLLSVKYDVEDGELVARPFLNDTEYRTFAPDAPMPDNDNRPVAARLLGTLAEAMEGDPQTDTGDDVQAIRPPRPARPSRARLTALPSLPRGSRRRPRCAPRNRSTPTDDGLAMTVGLES